MKHLKRFYNNLRLQTKFTITHLVIATIPMIAIGIILYTSLYDMIVSDTIRTEQNASAETAPLIEGFVDDILDAHQKVVNHSFYQSVIGANTKDSLNALTQSDSADEFKQYLSSITSDSRITDVRVYVDISATEKLFTANETYGTFLPIRYAQGTYWHGIFKGSSTSSLLCPSFYLSPYEINDFGDLAYITQSFLNYEGKRVPCYTAIYFSKKELTTMLQDNLRAATNVAYIINERDSLIVASDNGMAGTYHFDYQTVQESFLSSNNFVQKHVLGEDVYASFYRIKHSDWYMVVAMPSKPMIQKGMMIVITFLIVYSACIIIAFLIATALSRSITNRLSDVVTQMATVRTGPPAPMPDTNVQDEIGELIGTYNYMTTVIHQLIKEQAKAGEELRIAEFNSLQAQINPHFLYNTMDMINWLSQQGRSNDVTNAVHKLSRFYKLTLSRKQNINTIENEIEHVSIYIDLQNMRFQDNIDFLVDIPDSLMEYSIPKLTFQPVIENSIIHGIMEKEDRQGTIVLTGWMEEDTIVILISDDGVGIPPNILENILSGEGRSQKGSNIAIYNIHSRLKLLYGPAYGIHYSSTLGSGTEVEIRIPAEIADDSRMEEAVRALARPDKNLFEIIESCGFTDEDAFISEFKEKFGCTPEEYRRRLL